MASQSSSISQRTHQDVLDAFDQAPAAIALFEGDAFRLRFCNAQYEKIVGRALPLGESLWQLVPELRNTEFPQLMAGVIKHGATVVRENVWFTLNSRPQGDKRVMLNFTYAPWRDAAGRVRGVLVTIVDISAQTHAQARATAGEARLRAMADALPHGIFICEPKGKMRYVNERWKSLTGLTAETFGQAAWVYMVHPEDLPLVRSCWHGSTTIDGTMDVYARIRHKDATEYRWQRLLGRCYAEANATDLVWLCSWTDVHERVTHELARAASRKTFIATLSHDLRSPLAGIRASVENMQRKEEAAKPFEQKFGRIIQSIDRADAMLQSLLDIDRMTGDGPDNLVFTGHDLAELLGESLANHKAAHGGRCIGKLSQGVVGFWHGPSLVRAVDNLLGNAFKYGDVQRRVTLTVQHEGGWAHIAVHNWGNPIPEAEQQRMFVPYERGNTGPALGWGLGLSMVADVARRHQGSITVTSSEAAGTTFTLSVPRFASGLSMQELPWGA